jgi:acyl-CoA thioesterase
MSGTSFKQLLAAMSQNNDSFSVTLPDDWLQGRTAYGGLSAALCYEAALRANEDLPPLRSAQFAFIGPAVGELVITPTLLRRGKSAAFVGVDLMGEAGIAARALLCFGAERPSEQAYLDIAAPGVPTVDDSRDFFNRKGVAGFTQHFQGRLAQGATPCTPDHEPDMMVWVRHDDDDLPQGLTPVIALGDALPPASMIKFSKAAPVSSMTWSMDILSDDITSESGWWLLRAVSEQAEHGYSSQAMTLWDDKGRAVMAARQTVAIFI